MCVWWIEVSLAFGARRLWGKHLIRGGGEGYARVSLGAEGALDVSVGVNITWILSGQPDRTGV